ncbi:MAG: TetR family transcriptional regulator C-terminal domain-containing protein [Pseudomonadota bacterium]
MSSSANRVATQPRTRASKETRRGQLIDATLTAIERKGLAAVTLADVADGAGLSRGIVNFHFESKEKLLFAALSQLSEEYDRNWRSELAASPPDPANRMRTLILAEFAEEICTPRKLAAWFGFFGAAGSRPDYRDLCWARDDAYLDALEEICTALDAEQAYGINPTTTAMAIYAMNEGLWLRLMLGNAELTRERAIETGLAMLGTVFPRHFSPAGAVLAR